jgi:hypothetical protein
VAKIRSCHAAGEIIFHREAANTCTALRALQCRWSAKKTFTARPSRLGGSIETMRNQETHTPDKVACPFCHSADTEMIALFGMQLMTTQYYCNHCHSAFEAVKWEENKQKAKSEKLKDE